jgi:aspartokinase-like uncharacterized kinase
VDAVIKIGGSLAEVPGALLALGAKLSRLAKKHRFIVVPGGAGFADVVRRLDAEFNLAPSVSHRMAILAMDQYGLLLSSVFPDACVYESLKASESASLDGRLAIFLPSKLLLSADPFRPSWDVTSDSIAAYVATQLNVKKAVFVTNVDGIFAENPKKHPNAPLLRAVFAQELLKFGERTSVDKFLPEFLLKNQLDCYVVNGLHPNRVEEILLGEDTICTRIPPAK